MAKAASPRATRRRRAKTEADAPAADATETTAPDTAADPLAADAPPEGIEMLSEGDVQEAAAPDTGDTDDTGDANDAAPGTEAELKKPELIRRVVAASGMKKKDVKPVVEAMLKELGDALSNGETMNLQPFGKVQINRTKDKNNGEVIIVKVRRNQQAVDDTVPVEEKKPDDPLAEAAE